MFTGLIEEIGVVRSIRKGRISSQITIGANKVLEDVKTGDSICTDGACLTVVDHSPGEFTVDVMAETIRKTTLQKLLPGSRVNLERALKVGDRLGGHMVSGHIDGTGVISGMRREENAVWVTISTGKEILKYIIEKGSVAIDGISLTVAAVDAESFKVSIIPHTGNETTLLEKRSGDEVNLENDIVGKYIEKFVPPQAGNKTEKTQESRIDMDFLNEHGF